MDEQLEAVLGEDGSKVLPPGNRERTVEAMKLAMDGPKSVHVQRVAFEVIRQAEM